MEPIYFTILAYVMGSIVSVVLAYRYATERAVQETLNILVDEHYVRARILANGDIDLIRLPVKYRKKT